MKHYELEAHELGVLNHELLEIERTRRELSCREQAILAKRQKCIDWITGLSRDSATQDIPLVFTEIIMAEPSAPQTAEVLRLELIKTVQPLPETAEAA